MSEPAASSRPSRFRAWKRRVTRGLLQSRFVNELGDGGIVLLHNGEDGSLEVLPGLLSALATRQRLVGTVGSIINAPFPEGPALGP